MKHVCTINKLNDARPRIIHRFENDGKIYQVVEKIQANGNRQFIAFVYFDRMTSNVFGNGARCVFQSGWRRLPSYGPKHALLAREAELISLRAQVTIAQKFVGDRLDANYPAT